MSRTIDYYFTLASPSAFLGHQPFLDLAKANGATINCSAGARRAASR
jgi:2-hydroxychromene-2-carboxylate isomerase